MINKKKIAAFALSLFFVGASVSAFAQVPQNQPAQNPTLNQQQEKTKVSDEELKQFATVYPKVQEESQKAQQKMVGVIEKDGMKLERFNEIQTATMQNQKTDATEDEMKTYKKITGELDKLQPEIQKKMQSLITSSGLSVERFQAIAVAIQSDQNLQSRFQEMMNGHS